MNLTAWLTTSQPRIQAPKLTIQQIFYKAAFFILEEEATLSAFTRQVSQN